MTHNAKGQQTDYEYRKTLSIVIAVGLALRLAFVIYVSPHPDRFIRTDAIGYDQLAINLLAGNGFSIQSSPHYTPNNFRTPVYPLTLASIYAVLGHNPAAVLFLQAIMGAITILLVFHIAKLLINAKAGLFAAMLMAISPYSIVYVALLWSEVEYTLLITLAVFLTIIMLTRLELKWVAMSSFCLGIATLTHPRSLYLPFFFLVLLMARCLMEKLSLKQIAAYAILYLLVFNLVLLPWRARNQINFGVPNLTSASGINLLYYGAALAEASQTGESQLSIAERYADQIRARNKVDLNEAEFSNKAIQFALQKIAERPLPYAKAHLIGTAKVFLPGTATVSRLLTGQDDVNTVDVYGAFISNSFNLTSLIEALSMFSGLFWLYLVFAILYLILVYGLSLSSLLMDPRLEPWRWVLVSLIVFFAVIAGPVGSPRFRVVINPLLCVLASYGLIRLRRLFPRWSTLQIK